MLDDHGTCDVAPGVAHQVFEQRKFLAGEIDSLSRALHNALHAVQFQVADYQHRFRGQMAAAQQRPNARRKFAERERLRQVVVRTGVQALHPIFDLGALGQNQYRQAGLLQPQLAKHRDSIQFR